MRKQKSISAAVFAAILMFCLCGAVAVGGLVKVNDMAKAYEKSTPETVVKSLVTMFEKNDYEEIFQVGKISISPWEKENLGELTWGINIQNVEYSKKQPNVYEIKSEGNLLATASLKQLKGEGGFGFDVWELDTLKLNIPTQKPLKIEVPAGSTVFVNQKEYTQKLEKLPIENITSPSPITDNYLLKGFYYPPEVTATFKEKALTMELQDEKICGYMEIDDAKTKNLTMVVENAAKGYANFISNDAKFDDIKNYFATGTEFYKNLTQFYNGWYIPHDSFAFKDFKIDGWLGLDESHVKCNVAFTYIIKKGWKEHEYPSVYVVYLVETANGFKVADMVIS